MARVKSTPQKSTPKQFCGPIGPAEEVAWVLVCSVVRSLVSSLVRSLVSSLISSKNNHRGRASSAPHKQPQAAPVVV